MPYETRNRLFLSVFEPGKPLSSLSLLKRYSIPGLQGTVVCANKHLRVTHVVALSLDCFKYGTLDLRTEGRTLKIMPHDGKIATNMVNI